MQKADPTHVVDSINAATTANQINAVDAHLQANPTTGHKTLADIWPVVRPVLALLGNLFPASSVWGHAIRDLVAVGDAELVEEDPSDESEASAPAKTPRRKK